MEEVRDRTFGKGELVKTDGVAFRGCRFEESQLVYGGGPHPEFVDCTFANTGWYFEDAALRTIQLLQMNGNGEEGRAFIEDLFGPGRYIAA
jgi:hypothetical protein